MAAGVELAALIGIAPVDLLTIVDHQAAGSSAATLVIPDEDPSIQPGTSAWATFGRSEHC